MNVWTRVSASLSMRIVRVMQCYEDTKKIHFSVES
uniref:Uncharacterized protein n=1 Tax=Anguilla anguilla TaxID=7936 RepID=A0A0E9Q7C2_ANGAN